MRPPEERGLTCLVVVVIISMLMKKRTHSHQEILEALFESPAKIKVLRMFINNPGDSLSEREISARTRMPITQARRHIRIFKTVGLIKEI